MSASITAPQNLRQTALYDWHKAAGAKFTPFSGWEMPVLYQGIVGEHLAVRQNAGLFDVSHMGQFLVKGTNAFAFLQKVCTNDLTKCPPGKALYSHLCNEAGGVVDDIFIYCLAANDYLVIVNAGTVEKDWQWMNAHLLPNVVLENRSAEMSMIALQGPRAVGLAQKVFSILPERHQVKVNNFEGFTLYLCRTGYTGEDGLEFVGEHAAIRKIWEQFFELGGEFQLTPCGLGARDTLRLESGYLLYSQDVDDFHTPLEAGVPWVVQWGKGDFIGRAALEKQKAHGLNQKLLAFRMKERGIPRHEAKIFCNGSEAGVVTSGTFSPSLQCGVALGYVEAKCAGEFSLQCGGKLTLAEKVSLPFFKGGKV